ncbi:MAG: hypothetical protein ACOC0U_03695 [Desulfovibrionales bacterium]
MPTLILLISLAVFAAASLLGPGMRIEPFFSWYYLFAWWPYILAVESLLSRRGRSLLFDRTSRFFLLLPLSLCIWLLFEAFNFRLNNWHYLNLPSSTVLRWLGYAFSYATVLPALFATKRLLEELGFERFSPDKPLLKITKYSNWFIGTGILFLCLPLLWPKFFFPLVWGGFVFLLDPILYKKKSSSFLGEIRAGNWNQFFLWLSSGLICGLLWELWNFWAGSKWFYTVPFVGELKIFEMPLLGFFGFPPFALECVVLVRTFDLIRERIREKGKIVRVAWPVLALVLGALYVVCVFIGIDRFTVVTFGG